MTSSLRIVLAALVLLAVEGRGWAGDPVDMQPDLRLIPWPKSVRTDSGRLALTGDSRIVAREDQLLPLARILSKEMAILTGLQLAATTDQGRAGDIVLKIDPEIRAGESILAVRDREVARTTDGAHTIVIDERATITGFDYRATAEGTATILQLIGTSPAGCALPKLSIQDWPHADYCGVMLDVARQDHPIEAIKQVVQLCRLYKARYLQLHLTDDQGWTFPSTKYPQLGSKNYGAHGGIAPRVYPLAELKELVAYADARGVTLVPELELPGHAGAALRSLPDVFDAIDPQSQQPVNMGCMNMSNEALYPALEAIIGEMCDVFRSSPYFHIGSDEVSSGRLALHSGYREFLTRHGLKNDSELADHFISAACEMVKRQGKKAIKWEGLSNYATKDVIIMAWEGNSTGASEALSRDYSTITCPWNLGVPWEEWSMYRCNASQLKKGDAVLGATLVAWEQPPAFHVASLRNLPLRQERTWGPDNQVTVAGFAERFQPLDAVAGKLIGLPPQAKFPAAFTSSAGVSDFLEPLFALDGNDATFFRSAGVLRKGDHFTISFAKPLSVHSLEVLTGVNGRGLANGCEVEVSSEGSQFTSVGVLKDGTLQSDLDENRVRAVRIMASSDQSEPLVVRAVNLSLLVQLTGPVANPAAATGAGNVAALAGDTEFSYPIGSCPAPVINRGFALKVNNGGNPCQLLGPISGRGNIELFAGGENATMELGGTAANTLAGTWTIQTGRVVLSKPPGVAALGSTVVVGSSESAGELMLGASDQIADAATVKLVDSPGGARLNLNGAHERFAKLALHGKSKLQTDGSLGRGVLAAGELTIDGRPLAAGVYAAPAAWLEGSGYVLVGDVEPANVAGNIDDSATAIGANNLATLTAATTLHLPPGDLQTSVDTGCFPLTLTATGGGARFLGLIAGNGELRVEAPGNASGPLEIGGPASNSFRGPATLARGVLRLNKPGSAFAIPGDLTLGGSAAENEGDGVIWAADGQLSPAAVVTIAGDKLAFLDLAGHRAEVRQVVVSSRGQIRTGAGGALRVKQLHVAGQRLQDGEYHAPQPWLFGTGTVTVDARVDLQGIVGSPERVIGPGNIGNLVGDTIFAYPSGGGDFDILTNGHTLTLDSGNGNAFAYSGSIVGTGNVEFYMGPTYTDHKDTPLRLLGDKPNTTTGRFLVKKGRVQLEKPAGTDAISGDAIVGGQGFNDCLFWMNSDQVKDTATITLLDAGNSGAAYLHLSGCRERVARLIMTERNKVKTDGPGGERGTLTLRSLRIGNNERTAGTYTAATDPWIEGQGQVIVAP